MIKQELKEHRLTPKPIGETLFWMRWDRNGYRYTPQDIWTQRDWDQTIVTKINQVRVEIHKHCFSQDQDPQISKLTTGLGASLIFDDLPYFILSGYMLENDDEGRPYIGSFQGRYGVYRDVHQETNTIYIGTNEHPYLGCIVIDNL